jgi:CubicO group peptidase (beta-lactamase class C family)
MVHFTAFASCLQKYRHLQAGILSLCRFSVPSLPGTQASWVELDAPVRRYLPWLTIVPEDEAPNMTVRHLLNHTSGLSTADGWTHFGRRDSSDTAIEQCVRDLRQTRLRTPPGAAFQYSNANYDIAGAIIQAVSGDSYEAYVQRQVFAPLQMRSSFTSAVQAREHGLARGHRYWFGCPVATHGLPHPRGLIASGYRVVSLDSVYKMATK